MHALYHIYLNPPTEKWHSLIRLRFESLFLNQQALLVVVYPRCWSCCLSSTILSPEFPLHILQTSLNSYFANQYYCGCKVLLLAGQYFSFQKWIWNPLLLHFMAHNQYRIFSHCIKNCLYGYSLAYIDCALSPFCFYVTTRTIIRSILLVFSIYFYLYCIIDLADTLTTKEKLLFPFQSNEVVLI